MKPRDSLGRWAPGRWKWPAVTVILHLPTLPRNGAEGLATRLDRLVAARRAADLDEGYTPEQARRRHSRQTVIKQALVEWLKRRIPLEIAD